MVNYGLLTDAERVLMGIIVIFTNAATIPVMNVLLRKPAMQFEGIIGMMSGFTSFMYHLCEVLNTDIYLTELEWHRLDNVFVISGICIFIMHMLGNSHSRILIYLALITAILFQERYPWDLRFTIAPIVVFSVIGIVNRLLNWNKIAVSYNWGNCLKTAGYLSVGSYFFIKGLDEYDDYLRFNHGLWHLFSGAAIYYGLQACEVS